LEILTEICICIQDHCECNLVLCGDFNCDLDLNNSVTSVVLDFMRENNVLRCDSAA